MGPARRGSAGVLAIGHAGAPDHPKKKRPRGASTFPALAPARPARAADSYARETRLCGPCPPVRLP
jgi:hypothetical protein